METQSPRYEQFVFLTLNDYLVSIQPFQHLLQGPLVLHTLAAHYCTVQGAIKVASMRNVDLYCNQPCGTLGMSAATVHFASFSTYYIYYQPLVNCLNT